MDSAFIYRAANELVKNAGTRNIKEIARSCSLDISETSRIKDILGLLSLYFDKPLILINRQLNKQTKQLVCGYALGHYLEHQLLMDLHTLNKFLTLGDSRTPVIFLVISAMLNIIFDLLAILVLHMGVAGAAWATVLSQLISGILCFLYMRKQYDILRFEKDEIKFEGRQAIILCNMGIPMGLQYSITAIGSVILQTAVNSLGSQAVAAVTAAGRISGFSCCPFDALGSTMATYAGQNVGAGKLDRVGKGLKSASFIGGIYAIIAFFVLSLFGRQIALLFVSADEIAILDHVKQFLVFNTAFYIPLCLVNTVRFCIQGMGYSRLAILAGVCEMVGRIIASLVLVPLIGFVGICLASPIAWIMADLFLVPAYCHTINRMKKILAS